MKLQEVRTKKGLNQWDLRLLTGIHQSKISLFESGYILPTDEEKQRLAVALGVDPGELEFEMKTLAGFLRSTVGDAQQKAQGGIR